MGTTGKTEQPGGPALVWLRDDLRVADNPALAAGLRHEGPVIAVHIDATDRSLRRRGAASRWWRHHSLRAVASDLAGVGVKLLTLSGETAPTIDRVVREHRTSAVYWNRRYSPAAREIDAAIKGSLRAQGIMAESFAGNALIEPFDIATKSGTPYGVFTPFWNSLREREIPLPARRPARREEIAPGVVDADYDAPAWSSKLERHWSVGEAAAHRRLAAFLEADIAHYPEGRDYPAQDVTSRLSPHLAHGEISARQVWHAATALGHRDPAKEPAIRKFLSELAWRDFNIHQLYHRPDIAKLPMQERFGRLAWRTSNTDLAAWQRGETGFPLVDAGMRELWETGYMHNRVRMVAASVLVKTLLLDWRSGEQWFWDCLVDADEANNPGNWQWVAGCGTDAAPFFRIFNPLTQQKTFDPDGAYVRRWARGAHQPIVDLGKSRERALAAFRAL